MFNLIVESYFIIRLSSVFDSPKLACAAVLARYNYSVYLKKLIYPTKQFPDNKYGSPDKEFFLSSNKHLSKGGIGNPDKNYTYTMKHWVISPGEIFWILPNKYTNNHYILYQYAYDQDDMNKVFISNISTGKTALLSMAFLY